MSEQSELEQQMLDELLDLIASTASYCGKLYVGLGKAVENIRCNNIFEIRVSLPECLEGIQWVIDAIFTIKNITPDADSISLNPIQEILPELLEASENIDYVLMGDLLEYEILPIVDEWGNSLDELLACE